MSSVDCSEVVAVSNRKAAEAEAWVHLPVCSAVEVAAARVVVPVAC